MAESDEELYRAYLEQGEKEALRCLFERYREGLRCSSSDIRTTWRTPRS